MNQFELEIKDPESNVTYTLTLNEHDYNRALIDVYLIYDVYLTSLLEHAKKMDLELLNQYEYDETIDETNVEDAEQTQTESLSLLSPAFPRKVRVEASSLSNPAQHNIEETLISLIQEKPPLWDCRIPLVERSKPIKDKLWLEILAEFKEIAKTKVSLEILQKKWKNLRDTYIKTKSEVEAYVPSGSGATKKKKVWKHYDSLVFLSDTMTARKTVSNYSGSKEEQSTVTMDTITVDSNDDSTVLPKKQIVSNRNVGKRKVVHQGSAEPEEKILKAIDTMIEQPDINPICYRISDMLGKMPLKQRSQAEIELLNKAYELSEPYL